MISSLLAAVLLAPTVYSGRDNQLHIRIPRIVAEATSPKPERMRLSYSAESAVGFLARRMRRQTLNREWRSISRFDHVSMMADRLCDYLDWRIENGVLEVNVIPITGSWKQLRGSAAQQRSDLFDEGDTWLLPYFLCTFPHRVNGDFSGELDYRTSNAAFRSEWAS